MADNMMFGDTSFTVFVYTFTAFMGLIIGSFMNMLIYRVPRGLDTVRGHSICPECKHELGTADLVPFFSYIALRGRCRYCGCRISPRYFIVETANSILWCVFAVHYGLTLAALGWFVAVSALICAAFIDAYTLEVPDRFHAAIAVGGVLMAAGDFMAGLGKDSAIQSFLWGGSPFVTTREQLFPVFSVGLVNRAVGFFCVSGVFLLIALVSRGRAMGGADIKLTAVMGFALGWRAIIIALFLGSLFGVVGSIVSNVIKKRRGDETTHVVPFVPYLAAGMIIAAIYGDRLFSLILTV